MNIMRLLAIIKKEFIHIRRDKASLGVSIMMPLMFILVFGYAVNTDVEDIRMAILDGDKTQTSRELIDKFANSNYFIPYEYVNSINEVEGLIDQGIVKTGLVIPAGMSRSLNRGEEPQIQLIIDGTDPTIARTALQSGVLVSKMFGTNNQLSSIKKPMTKLLDLRTRVWYNPNLESTQFTIPGLIGLIMQNVTVMLTAFALVRERERGTIEQLIVTPIKSIELILGKMVPYILIGSLGFLMSLFFGTYWFNVPIKGDLSLLLLFGFGFVICALAIGMLISTIAKNQLQAMQMTIIIILPSVLLSGFVFPRESMPDIIQGISYIIPLTYFLNILRGIILKGIGFSYLWKDVLYLLIIGTLLLVIAAMRFKKKLD